MAEQEWYTLQEIAEKYGVAYHKIRTAVAVLENTKAINTKEDTKDNRIKLVHRDSVQQVLQGAGAV